MSKTPRDKGEIFSQKRMDRCADIFLEIQNATVRSGKWDYSFKATGPVSGLTFDEFRKQYLLVGTTKKQREIPLLDAIVVWSMIKQEHKRAMMLRKRPQEDFKVKTSWTDDELAVVLSEMQIATPFDDGKVLRIAVKKNPPEDQQAQ